jgi:hypothetical protein
MGGCGEHCYVDKCDSESCVELCSKGSILDILCEKVGDAKECDALKDYVFIGCEELIPKGIGLE